MVKWQIKVMVGDGCVCHSASVCDVCHGEGNGCVNHGEGNGGVCNGEGKRVMEVFVTMFVTVRVMDVFVTVRVMDVFVTVRVMDVVFVTVRVGDAKNFGPGQSSFLRTCHSTADETMIWIIVLRQKKTKQ
jgi:hypothetical protein